MIKNAIAYITRKRNRTMIMLIILTLVLSCLYACLSISKSQKSLEKSLYDNSNSSISITKKDKNGYFKIKDFEKIQNIKGIKEISYHYEGFANLTNSNVVESQQKVMREDLSDNMKNLVSIDAMTNQKRNNLFTSNVLSIKKGRNLNLDDMNKILVHEEFAKKNKLKLNDKIGLKFMNMNGNGDNNKETQYEIVGIFSGKKQEKYTGLSSDFSENSMFVNYNSAQNSLNLKNQDKIVNKISVYTQNSDSMNNVINQIKNQTNNLSQYIIEKDDNAFKEAIDSINGVKHIIQMMTYSIMIAGLVVLSLILILWLRERIYEIGILLSIGVSKAKIIGQFIMELVFVSVPAALLSYISGYFIMKQIVSGITKSENASFAKSLLITKLSDKIEVFIKSYGLLLIIIAVSVIIASGIILIKKPKQILSQIS
ncbi:MAG: ABC transporter permease [Finegoldia magna]|uniref:ABC transporter permease n=1 Tax=Finegoldia magna TaxID=1260 RepID=UPI0025E151AF|nr:ABC transporter permease [Finegoldia magna]MBS5776952.1 ABC transporter permease [Finegoldia magna]MDU1832342.1 ABC transporter permease [Finegoldia magna]MDU2575953.1 ABC transporter permease [Finegoldia magna]MDU7478486.1 ABC transporter permease [Finegoldia magna]